MPEAARINSSQASASAIGFFEMVVGPDKDPAPGKEGARPGYSGALLKVGLSLKRSVECAVAVIFAVNLLVFFGPFEADVVSGQSGPISNYLGPLVPFIWILWFVFMGAAFHFEVKRAKHVSIQASGILLLFALCALYPLYTFGFRSLVIGLIANMAMIVLLVFLIPALWRVERRASVLLMPIAVWLGIASIWIAADLTKVPF